MRVSTRKFVEELNKHIGTDIKPSDSIVYHLLSSVPSKMSYEKRNGKYGVVDYRVKTYNVDDILDAIKERISISVRETKFHSMVDSIELMFKEWKKNGIPD